MESITKTKFKQMHKNGELLLLGSSSTTKEDVAAIAQKAIDAGELPSGEQTTPGGYGSIDDRHHKVYMDEANGIVYLERIEVGDDWKKWSSDAPLPLTVVYRVQITQT